MNKEKLINQYEKMKANKKRLTSVDLVLKDLRHLDEPEPLPFKLKDVIKRIKGFDNGTKFKWTYDILQELGSDFYSKTFHEAYQQGKFEWAWVGNQLKDADKIRQELHKPVVKQFIADWYEENKDSFEANLYRFVCNLTLIFNGAKINEFERWFLTAGTKPFQTLINMHQFGYNVEKEKQYIIKLKGVPDGAKFLKYAKVTQEWYFGMKGLYSDREIIHTRKELEDLGFGWVFDCEGIEIEEVEE